MKRHFYLFVFTVIGFCGCGKDRDDTSVVLAGDYQTATTITANPITMYTKNGAVTDTRLVDNFINRKQLGGDYFNRTTTAVPNNSSATLKITADNQATLTYTNQLGSSTTKAEITLRSAQYFVLSNVDSVTSIKDYQSANRCATLSEQIKSVYPAARCRPVSIYAGQVSQACKFRPVHVITIRDGQLFLPQFSWLIQSGQPATSYCGLVFSNEPNTFNPAILNQLAAEDTIVVQVKEIALLKK